ncbi:N-acetylglucosamine-specific PTS transporter subunit IIBC [Crenobacter sp. SG2303]|uniref:N-acetylglucosamine-specific PTS transporter subunit IIBC n=1 Tax=Crenobacter oryzisoli TaxID=3056844 RepID=A0ABT7XLQ8_9NEIS|nr:N-acetylglucosamine-specific PTS transporter subunit IIBC [Crenobacter sp. SG2303]MDN0074713.1 N-acetylglucosamine-specific PTS transporter subunit IIBC [Crenobacter sp. SG2303]
MSGNNDKFAKIQQLGRALMLPIAVLPVAGLMLRLGQPDLLDIKLLAQAGDAIFGNLALIFAIGVAVGFAKDNNGTAGLAGVIGYLVLTAVLKVMPDTLQAHAAGGGFWALFVHLDDAGKPVAINMGVLAGIVSGIVAGNLYNRYKDIQLPPYLAFFGGKRFVPIATGFACLLLALLFGLIWPPIQSGIDAVGHWLINAGEFGLFVYGVLNRLLIVTGLHHILNSFAWFVFGSFTDAAGKLATGDLNRFFAGDPSAGSFMTGFFPVMMFGLPAACLAMYRHARPENKKAVGGVLLSMALTAMLTGVTEPVEFAFMFLAPMLYAVHAMLTGVSMALMHLMHVRLGFTFSAGLFDFLLSMGKGENGLTMLAVGVVYFAVYYGLFSFCIRRFDLPTLGREATPAAVVVAASGSERGLAYLAALGGSANLKAVDACTTRLRLQVVSNDAVDEPALKALGARGMIRPAAGSVQVVIGPEADLIADEVRAAWAATPAATASVPTSAVPVAAAANAAPPLAERERWLAALGGSANLRSVSAVAGNRLRLSLVDAARLDETALVSLGAFGVQRFSAELAHVVLNGPADSLAGALVAR